MITRGIRRVWRDCRLVKLSHYQHKFRDIEKTIWRYEFLSIDGIVVYSGRWLNIKQGAVIDLKGTIERYEYYGRKTCVRLKRVIALEKVATPLGF